MEMEEFEKLGVFLQAIPAYDLQSELHCKHINILSFLGKINLDRKLLGVLAQCLKKEFGKQVFMNYEYINKFVSILCGFGVEDLEQINEDNFILINQEVFISLDQCNSHQRQVLYEIAVRPTVYGIPQGWSKSVVRTIGTLLAITPIKDLIEMDPLAFQGLQPKVLRALDDEKIHTLKVYLRYFDLSTKNEFWKIVGVPSGFRRVKREYSFLYSLILTSYAVKYVKI
ncbi:hypothetical protein HHI36_009312 [Cryptolaemus montrouzieri]|uniref:Uncharacterized protein n=1 Tax=Cryptolaemus montrouzieri TaxID=559131 RepID=A0ABD2MV45_9CUCU